MKSWVLYIYSILCSVLPPTKCFGLKRSILKLAGAKVGTNVRCVSSATFFLNGPLTIGRNTWIGHEVLIVGGDAPVSIGPNCDIAPRVTFASGTHYKTPEGPGIAGKGYSLPITLGEGCWVCTGVTILGGTTIGARSIVAAGAVVKGDFPADSLIGGVPARVLSKTLDSF